VDHDLRAVDVVQERHDLDLAVVVQHVRFEVFNGRQRLALQQRARIGREGSPYLRIELRQRLDLNRAGTTDSTTCHDA
jgi:hypothetical protein